MTADQRDDVLIPGWLVAVDHDGNELHRWTFSKFTLTGPPEDSAWQHTGQFLGRSYVSYEAALALARNMASESTRPGSLPADGTAVNPVYT